MRGKRHLYTWKHPFDEYPFEAFFRDCWQSVEFIRIKDGVIAMHLDDNRCLIEEKRPFSNLRVKSRRATLSDCTCFLRPGIDVCVLTASRNKESSDEENLEPVWVDARIKSVERKPHETECSCQFYVSFHVNNGPLGSERVALSQETESVGIDQISILQRLEKEACEDQHYRWNYSENCSSLQKSKLFLGKFSSDLSWLLVASVLKQTAFDVRSVQNKIVYQILGGDDDDDDDANCSSSSNNRQIAINFRADDDILTSYVVQIVLDDGPIEALPACEVQEPQPLTFYDVMDLRRSKRRNVQPERFLASEITPESNIGWVRMLPYRIDREEEEDDDDDDEEDMHLPLSYLFGAHGKYSEENIDSKSNSLKSGEASLNENINELAIVPVPTESDPIACYQNDQPAKNPGNCSRGNDDSSSKYYITSSSTVQRRNMNTYKVERMELKSKRKGKAPKYYSKGSYSEPQKGTGTSELEYMELESRWGANIPNKKDKGKNFFGIDDMGFENSSWGKPTNKRGVQGNRYRPISSKQGGESCEKVNYKKATLSAGAYNRLINNYMKNIDHTVTHEEPSIIDQWNQFKESKTSEQKMEMEESSSEEEEELSEMDMLWKEMELSLASAYILENSEGPNTCEFPESMETPTEGCQHEFVTDEEIGIICRLCNFVTTEIRYVTAPFVQQKGYTVDNKMENEEYSVHKPDEDESLNIFCNQDAADTPLSEENDNVWALIPEHKTKLRLHQKKAFEFLWKNVAGSLEPALMEKSTKKTGGCVVSHTPGAGKTFLIIAFLVSYLKLFPGKRPLVLAPKTTLYTWYKEFIKWKIPIPVHLIHGRRTYKVCKQQRVRFSQGGPKPSHDVMHVLDCLEKIQKWHAQPSVLVMGYTSFLTLMREDSRFAHRKFMAKVLRESPGILILDEGHNPRSTKSRLRKVLMKVETDYRILLSGTLFQNNFCEYFNTLCLARPKFINEVLKVLDPKFKEKTKGVKKARHLLEARARKFFIDNIARRIDLEGEERREGLNMLRSITTGFIDVYEGGADGLGLPGLQIYTLMMNATDVQHKVLVKLRDIMGTYHGYPLELELLITLASIHPWLVRTSNCAHKFFSPQELMELDRYKYEFRKGSKVMFVLNLVHRVVKDEKVLIFCHNIAPIQLFAELFQQVFRWQKGKEILILTGDLELFDRGRIMDRFEEPGGPSRVLLASITACAEGISLTAASRVIMLDSEWNPSKTKQAIARAFRPGQQKVVYVYQLLGSKTLEEDKYRRTTWKEWVSCMIFSEAFVEDPSRWQAEKIEDEVLREIVEEDRAKSFHMIMKNEKASTG
ncbi:hypothetical protein Dsin_001601 [Dipteronia sinensis]|uniref:Uncharacterized protein n=1 Tax=Dipteronia sinensis TaxID=43782 RepID=A0AAE0EKG1_9ROSI|nr:hypothetical protein Dsin_001601 [Dipteronia sinensis]